MREALEAYLRGKVLASTVRPDGGTLSGHRDIAAEEEGIMRATPFRQAEAEALAAMTPEERARFDSAEAEEEVRLQLAELVYAARTRARLTQTELAKRMGTQQSVISAVENGGQIPSVSTLWRIAHALNLRLTIDMAAAS